MTKFTVIRLEESRFDLALPLIRMAAPMMNGSNWRDFVRILVGGTGGILAAFAADGRPHGIAAYCPDQSLLHGRVLRVEPLVTFEVNRDAPVRLALCEALEQLARSRGCEAIIIAAASRGYVGVEGPKAGRWGEIGFELASIELVKRLEPVAPAAIARAAHCRIG